MQPQTAGIEPQGNEGDQSTNSQGEVLLIACKFGAKTYTQTDFKKVAIAAFKNAGVGYNLLCMCVLETQGKFIRANGTAIKSGDQFCFTVLH